VNVWKDLHSIKIIVANVYLVSNTKVNALNNALKILYKIVSNKYVSKQVLIL